MIFHKVKVPGPLLALLGRDRPVVRLLQRAPSVSDHSVFAHWVVAYGRFDFI